METLLSTFAEKIGSQQYQNFSQDDNNFQKKKKEREQQNQIIEIQNSKHKLMVKFRWDECIPHDFTCYIYKNENHTVISNPKLTY